MRKKLKPELDLESIQSDLIETVCYNYQNGVSVRALAKQMGLSPMKTRKILITGGCYSTDLSTEIEALYKDGKTISQIAELLNTTPANVNSYLPTRGSSTGWKSEVSRLIGRRGTGTGRNFHH